MATLIGGGVDLSPCTGLQTLIITLSRQFLTVDKHAMIIKGLLSSWKPQDSQPTLVLCASSNNLFTRRQYADAVRGLGTITEGWLQTVEEPSTATADAENHPNGVQYQLRIEICDWDAERKWWSDHLDSCFPTWARLGRLSMDFSARESRPIVPLSPRF